MHYFPAYDLEKLIRLPTETWLFLEELVFSHMEYMAKLIEKSRK